jgi:hypothetical protein
MRTITVFEPVNYTSRFIFDGREGKMQPYFATVKLKFTVGDNTPAKKKIMPFLNVVKVMQNRHIVWIEDPALYSGYLEPKNGRSVQEYYADIKKIIEVDSLWWSDDSQAVQNTLGGMSLCVIKEQPTVEALAFYIAEYIKRKGDAALTRDYISIEVSSNNSPYSGKAAECFFRDV